LLENLVLSYIIINLPNIRESGCSSPVWKKHCHFTFFWTGIFQYSYYSYFRCWTAG